MGGGCGGLTTAKTFFASRICCKDLPYQFSGKSDNSKYGLLQLQIISIANLGGEGGDKMSIFGTLAYLGLD